MVSDYSSYVDRSSCLQDELLYDVEYIIHYVVWFYVELHKKINVDVPRFETDSEYQISIYIYIYILLHSL